MYSCKKKKEKKFPVLNIEQYSSQVFSYESVMTLSLPFCDFFFVEEFGLEISLNCIKQLDFNRYECFRASLHVFFIVEQIKI